MSFLLLLDRHQRCLDELEVLDQVSRLTADAFESNRRLSETNLLDLKPHKGHCRASSPHIFVEHDIDDAGADTINQVSNDNPFQNDKLPLWQGCTSASAGAGGSQKSRSTAAAAAVGGRSSSSEVKKRTAELYSNASSPENNNYGGPQQAYRYKSLNETPTSPELANHRDHMTRTSPAAAPASPEIIQVKNVP